MNMLDLFRKPANAPGYQRRAVVWCHRLGDRISERGHAHASPGSHYDRVSDHEL